MDTQNRTPDSLYALLFQSGPYIRLVNLVTLYRILSVPVLAYAIYAQELSVFKWMLLLSFASDAIDGYLARRFKAGTALGAMLDSTGDILTIILAIIGFVVVYPAFVSEQKVLITVLCSLFILQIVYALIRYQKFSSFHTYLSKVAAVVQGTFFLVTFFFDTVFYPLFYTASFITGISLIEEIMLTYLLPQWKTNVRGLYWYMIGKTV
jgi:phosphatidylglycerophosphate synthase